MGSVVSVVAVALRHGQHVVSVRRTVLQHELHVVEILEQASRLLLSQGHAHYPIVFRLQVEQPVEHRRY